MVIRTYLFNIAYAFFRGLDMVANSILGGDPRETISRRMGRLIDEHECVLCKWVCHLLNLIDKNHCVKAASSPPPDGSLGIMD